MRDAGATSAVMSALDALTQRPNEDVSVYLGRCRANPLAREVKRYDLLDKLQPGFLGTLSPADAVQVAAAVEAKLDELDGHVRTTRTPGD